MTLHTLKQVKERLLKILTFWSDRKLYDKDTMQQLEAALLSGDPNAMLQAPAPKQVCNYKQSRVTSEGCIVTWLMQCTLCSYAKTDAARTTAMHSAHATL